MEIDALHKDYQNQLTEQQMQSEKRLSDALHEQERRIQVRCAQAVSVDMLDAVESNGDVRNESARDRRAARADRCFETGERARVQVRYSC